MQILIAFFPHCPFDHWLPVILILGLDRFAGAYILTELHSLYLALTWLKYYMLFLQIPTCILVLLHAWYFSWTWLAAVEDNGPAFRTGFRRESKDWPLIGENILQLAGDDSGLFTNPWYWRHERTHISIIWTVMYVEQRRKERNVLNRCAFLSFPLCICVYPCHRLI